MDTSTWDNLEHERSSFKSAPDGISSQEKSSKISSGSSALQASQLSIKRQRYMTAFLAIALVLFLMVVFAFLLVLVREENYHTMNSEDDFSTKNTRPILVPTFTKTSSFSTKRTQSVAVSTGKTSAPPTTPSRARKEETTTHPGEGETSTTTVTTSSTSATTSMPSTTSTTSETRTTTVITSSTAATTTVPSTTSTTSEMRTTTVTTSSTAATTTMPSTTSTTRRSIPVGSLICTVGAEALTPTVVLPEDGLCSYLFFDSLFRGEAGDILNTTSEIIKGSSPSYGGSLKFFIERARAPSQTTEYGLGFSRKGRDQARDELKSPASNGILRELYNHRILHYGFIDITITHFGGLDMKNVLLTLKIVAEKMSSWSTAAQPALTWVAAPFGLGMVLSPNFKVFTSIFVPDVLLFSGHRTSEDYGRRSVIGCRMVPPTYMDPPGGVSLMNNISLRAPQRAIKESYPAVQSPLGLRVPLYARFYVPMYPDSDTTAQGNFSFFHLCNRTETLFDYPLVQLCNDPLYANTSYDSQYDAEFSFNKAKKRFFTYDSIRAFRNKLCKFKKDLATIPFNLAVANIEHEDSTGQCGHGAFYRLRFLKRLAAFFRDNFTSPDALDDCLRLH